MVGKVRKENGTAAYVESCTGIQRRQPLPQSREGCGNNLLPGLHATPGLEKMLTDRAKRNGTNYGVEEQRLPTKRLVDPDDFGAFRALLYSDYANHRWSELGYRWRYNSWHVLTPGSQRSCSFAPQSASLTEPEQLLAVMDAVLLGEPWDLKRHRREVTQIRLVFADRSVLGNGTTWKVSQSKHWSASLRDAGLVVPFCHNRSLARRSSAFSKWPRKPHRGATASLGG